MQSSVRPITAVILTLNEAHIIGDCIRSLLPICDEILVLDSGSTDDTIQIAQDLGVTIIETEWLGFGNTKNKGNEAAKNDWILSIDADEVVDKLLKDSLLNASINSPNIAYQINRLPYYEQKWIKHSGWHPDWITRLFHRDTCHWSSDKVHEKLICKDHIKKIKLSGYLQHFSYKSKEDHYQRMERYARLQAEAWIDKNEAPSIFKRLFGPHFKFFKSYILKRGYKDGKAGLAIAESNKHLVKRQLALYDKLLSESKKV